MVTEVEITLKQALLGFEKEIKHLDGHMVKLKRENIVTQHNQQQIIRDEGMPKYGMTSDFGNLTVIYKVRFPETLTESQRYMFK